MVGNRPPHPQVRGIVCEAGSNNRVEEKMMTGTIATKLNDVNVDEYWQPGWPQGQNLINSGTGELTHTITPDGLVFFLSVTGGNRPIQLRLGELVTASGTDSSGRRIIVPAVLQTINTGDPAIFTGQPANLIM